MLPHAYDPTRYYHNLRSITPLQTTRLELGLMTHDPLGCALRIRIYVHEVSVVTFDLVCPCNSARKYQDKLLEKQIYAAPFDILGMPS
jgi:hypothetical protein